MSTPVNDHAHPHERKTRKTNDRARRVMGALCEIFPAADEPTVRAATRAALDALWPYAPREV